MKRLFIGPGISLRIPIKKGKNGRICFASVPFGYWYEDSNPLKKKKATEDEVYTGLLIKKLHQSMGIL